MSEKIMAAVSDDEIIKKRLLIDGDGGNDDKRIMNLLKLLIRLCSSTDPEEDSTTVQRMLAMLAQCEHTMEKSSQVYDMNLVEQKSYENLNQEIEDKIASARQKISECKDELQQAKKVRKHRQEYDALAKVIQQQPDRLDTTKKLETLAKELAGLEEAKGGLEQKLSLRRKQFHVLIASIHELQKILEDDDEKTQAEMEEKPSGEMDTS